FSIENIKRKNKAGKVAISWDGSPLEVEKSKTTTYEIPALSDYRVLSAKLIRGEESYLSVHFSDPLATDQNHYGLVQIHQQGDAPRTVVNLNELKIYPGRISGDNLKLTIYQEVESIEGKKLANDYTETLAFNQQNPELKLTLK